MSSFSYFPPLLAPLLALAALATLLVLGSPPPQLRWPAWLLLAGVQEESCWGSR